jgi:hypothetical protein
MKKLVLAIAVSLVSFVATSQTTRKSINEFLQDQIKTYRTSYNMQLDSNNVLFAADTTNITDYVVLLTDSIQNSFSLEFNVMENIPTEKFKESIDSAYANALFQQLILVDKFRNCILDKNTIILIQSYIGMRNAESDPNSPFISTGEELFYFVKIAYM